MPDLAARLDVLYDALYKHHGFNVALVHICT